MDFLKKHRALIALNLALLLLALACVAGFAAVSGTLAHLDSAKNWRGENELLYSYVSCFMPVDRKIDENAVYNFKNTVDALKPFECLFWIGKINHSVFAAVQRDISFFSDS